MTSHFSDLLAVLVTLAVLAACAWQGLDLGMYSHPDNFIQEQGR